MNPFHPLLSRDRLARRCLYGLILAVLFARALLSGTVMVDPDAAAGSFGLVICSGQGPMFSNMTMGTPSPRVQGDRNEREDVAHGRPMATMAMPMSMPAAAAHGRAREKTQPSVAHDAPTPQHVHIGIQGPMIDHHVGGSVGTDSGSAGICAFSAAFLIAIAALFVFTLFLISITVERFRHSPGDRHLAIPTAHSRPLSRAPPALL